jgi:hypothetical protein
MIQLPEDIQKFLYNTLTKIDKLPKLAEVDPNLKELIKNQLFLTRTKCIISNPESNLTKLNITDKMVNSYIGAVLKKIRKERAKITVLNKRIDCRSIEVITTISKWGDWEYIECPTSGSRYRPTTDRMKRDFTNLMLVNKTMTKENAKEIVMKKYTIQIEQELNRYIDEHFR